MCECNGCSYAIRLKQKQTLISLASDKDAALYEATKKNQIEKPYGQLTHMYTFIVTNMDMQAYQIIQFYCGRGKMENFIKEGKSGFEIGLDDWCFL